ncbi:GerMN domain-containing protein [Leptospira borgpetersenii]|uniref:GerMN domain-containing protein n=1 Tax=Leptospira borgpetersenii TaxID=174 RepID=UPI00077307A0|nr:GerMN domain-containing protein [Leptospira borgpetersenii]MBE8364119.1 GerMN domain-containing protein [Leptospira borgpetersenii serovar Balcanica]MBE8369172.1 GerMN domain-containing protein [Leptospira borgpetersenii serovar Balcanica]MBE8398721.1 GerMN domain-containing protein [Leptospira borgpetersenii serovar Tarassovi]MBE8402935.1 GerMN domain-containing protein [Leptospira borgpetersenii serovar Tarassovi]MBE8405819.1 GerMN domain-containing protein [Leptospira borgpetersenii sero
MPDSEKRKNLIFILTGIIFTLVLLDKSTGSGFSLSGIEFRNIGKMSPESYHSKGNLNHKELMDQAEDEILGELLQNGDVQVSSENENSIEEDLNENDLVPVLEPPLPSINLENESPSAPIPTDKGELSLYFLKFYGKGSKSHSRLVRVLRLSKGGDRVKLILNSLIAGPVSQEKEKGILNSIPQNLHYDGDYRIEEGILKLSLSSDLERGAGPELLKDRIDQLTYSLMENLPIRGIQLKINGKFVRSLGGEGMPLPSLLTKNPRKIVVF